MSAETTITHVAPGQVRIVLREGASGVTTFVGFVIIVAVAVYALTPAAGVSPGPLLGVVAAALVWAGIARALREDYFVDGPARSLRVRRTSVFGVREEHVDWSEVTTVRLVRGGPDDDRLLVELSGPGRDTRLRIPRRVNTLSAPDQQVVGQLLAEHLGVPLHGS